MRKILSILVLACIPMLLAPTHSQALPIIGVPNTGSVLFDLNAAAPGTNVATVNWSVYAPGDTAALSGSATDYTYQYTLNGWSGIDPSFGGIFEVWTGASPAITGSGTASTGTVPAFSWIAGPALNSWVLDVSGGTFTSPSSSITGWLTSAIAPTESVAQLGTGPKGASTLGASVGLAIDGQSIQAMNSGTLPDLGAPGVPEPETWALLLAMMAFTTLWMRRRQDDDAPLELSITA